MSIKKRVGDLERLASTGHTAIPDAEKVQVLRPGESAELKRAALIEKYGSARGVLFVRIKGQDA